jgi:RNA-binding protein
MASGEVWQVPPSPKERRELAARGHHLKASVCLSAEVAEEHVWHVRRAFAADELVKVRIRGDDRAAREQAARELAVRVPCEIVRRIGRVVLLYRPRTGLGQA